MSKFDVNKISNPPSFEAVPYINDTKRAAIHITSGDFQDVVFLVDKVYFDDQSPPENPEMCIDYTVIEWDKKLYPNITEGSDFDDIDEFKDVVAKIMSTVIMSSISRAIDLANDSSGVKFKKPRKTTRKGVKNVSGNKPRKARKVDSSSNDSPPEVPE